MTPSTLPISQLVGLAEQAGFRGQAAATAAAIAMAESSGDPRSAGDVNLGGAGATSFGLWQVHTPAHPEYTAAQLFNPAANAAAAFKISSGGTNWRPWTTYNTGAYRQYLPAALKAAKTGGSALGQASATPAGSTAPTSSTSSGKGFQTSDLKHALVWIGLIAMGAVLFGIGLDRAAGGMPARAAKQTGHIAGATAAAGAAA